MRSILDFYRRNPLVLVVALAVGAVLSISAAAGTEDGLGDLVAVMIVGVFLGCVVAWRRSRRERLAHEAAAGDPTDPRGPAAGASR